MSEGYNVGGQSSTPPRFTSRGEVLPPSPPTGEAQPNDEHREFWLRWCRDFFILESGIAGPHVPWLNELLKSHPADAPEDPNWYLTVRDWIDGLFDSDCEQIRRNPSVRAALHRKTSNFAKADTTQTCPKDRMYAEKSLKAECVQCGTKTNAAAIPCSWVAENKPPPFVTC